MVPPPGTETAAKLGWAAGGEGWTDGAAVVQEKPGGEREGGGGGLLFLFTSGLLGLSQQYGC